MHLRPGWTKRSTLAMAPPLLPLACALLTLLLQRTTAQSPFYSVPPPVIEALSPRGLRISIPDELGVELFAVHANINKPMGLLEAGQISVDITKPKAGRWVYEDRRVRLKPGDVINYWLYVQADGLGYRRTTRASQSKSWCRQRRPLRRRLRPLPFQVVPQAPLAPQAPLDLLGHPACLVHQDHLRLPSHQAWDHCGRGHLLRPSRHHRCRRRHRPTRHSRVRRGARTLSWRVRSCSSRGSCTSCG
ncbi:uncharacterized protein LOC126355748 [Schistocerca gregaria]|uniref:uncharacterized protein LOC126355748 n=1 Tax=Schistocerca gregaria TaxID=7010 RepID=UPI00211E1960|nr:uncharacterized protein LOC126355748 [Schistocerca gregaria]